MIIRQFYTKLMLDIVRQNYKYTELMQQYMQEMLVTGKSDLTPQSIAEQVAEELQLPTYKEWLTVRRDIRIEEKKWTEKCPVIKHEKETT